MEQIPFPKFIPEQFNVNGFKEAVYDFKVHLDLQMPEYIINLKFDKFDLENFDFAKEEDCSRLERFLEPGLAFTSPFKVLTDEGLRVLNEIIEHHKENTPQLSKQTNRQAWCMRGLGYVSKFIRDFNRCPFVAKKMSLFAGKQITSHAMPMNFSHINIGVPGTGKKVDQWHLDSVGYVLVVLMSDTTDMVGGELQVLTRDRSESAVEILNSQTDSYTPSEILTVEYGQAGRGVFMQGSHIFHQVKSVVSGPRPRISLVNSFMVSDCFEDDWTKFSTFRDGDPKNVTYLEYARLVAHRSKLFLDNAITNIQFNNLNEESEERGHKKALGLIERAINELKIGYSLLNHESDDHLGFYDESSKKLLTIVKS